MAWIVSLRNSYVGALTLGTSGWGCVWRQGLKGVTSYGEAISVGANPVWPEPSSEEETGHAEMRHACAMGRPENGQREGGSLQAKETGPGGNQFLILDSQTPELRENKFQLFKSPVYGALQWRP